MATSRVIESTVPVSPDTGALRRRRLGVVMVVALLAQTVLGVANELWTSLPESGDGFAGASPRWLLSLHVLVGTVALVVAAVLAVSARRSDDRAWTTASLIGLLALVGAWVSGHFFLETRGADVLSLSMAVLGVAALGAYVAGLVRAAGQATEAAGSDPAHTSHPSGAR
jgi:hypothetical protein